MKRSTSLLVGVVLAGAFILFETVSENGDFGDALVPIAMVVIGLAVFLGIMFFQRYTATKRREDTQAYADSNGYSFQESADPVFTATTANFKLFDEGRKRKATNILRKRERGADFALFDYSWVTGRGRSTQTHKRSTMLIRADNLNLKPFTVKPKSLWKKIGIGKKSIEFDGYDDFNKQFYVESEHAETIRATFGDAVLRAIMRMVPVSIESNGESLVLFRDKQYQVDDLQSGLITYGHELYDVLGNGSDKSDDQWGAVWDSDANPTESSPDGDSVDIF